MTFEHNFLLPKYKLKRIAKPDGRYYELPSGKHVLSVTNILSRYNAKSLNDWKERVGQVEADKISTQAKVRGTAVHDLCEKYLLNKKNISEGAMPFNYSEFKKIQSILDKYVNLVYGVEYMVYSEELCTAGTTDLICNWKGETAIVDFKTSKYSKNETYIHHYFIQATCYALMVEHLYNIQIPKIIIIMAVDHEEPVVFEKSKKEFMPQVSMIFGERI